MFTILYSWISHDEQEYLLAVLHLVSLYIFQLPTIRKMQLGYDAYKELEGYRDTIMFPSIPSR
jgi:hypothetical protein